MTGKWLENIHKGVARGKVGTWDMADKRRKPRDGAKRTRFGVQGTGNRDGHAAVGPGSNTAKPEKERETKPPDPDGREEAGIHAGASSPPPDPYYLKVLCRSQL